MYSFTFETKTSNYVKEMLGVNTDKSEKESDTLSQEQIRGNDRPNIIPDVWITDPFKYKNYKSTDDYQQYFADFSTPVADHGEQLRTGLGNVKQAIVPDHETLTE